MLEITHPSGRGEAPRDAAGPREPQPAPDAAAALRRLLPVPLAEAGTVMAAIGVKRSAAQAAPTNGIRSGDLRLAHDRGGVVVVAGGEP